MLSAIVTKLKKSLLPVKFISKFSFIYWLGFIVVVLPIYAVMNMYIIESAKEAETEKISLLLDTYSPLVGIKLYLEQDKEIDELMENMINTDGIVDVELYDKENNQIKSRTTQTSDENRYVREIYSPVDARDKIGTMKLYYSNEKLKSYTQKILNTFSILGLFLLSIFFIAYGYIRKDFIFLSKISDALKKYSQTKEVKLIPHTDKASAEISTIGKVANEMFLNIAESMERLKGFNEELENKVKNAVKKQKKQEEIMLHQSRQVAMGEMVESIAHQWRQPLNIIGLAISAIDVEYIMRDGKVPHDVFEEKKRIIDSSIKYMSDTIDDFRSFLDSSETDETFNLKECVLSVTELLKEQMKNYKTELSIKIDEGCIVSGSQREFKQVIYILINNSKDAIIAKKEKNGIIDISLKTTNKKIKLEVYDNGGGIAEEIIGNIFEPYFSTKKKTSGTGVGLYIAKRIVEDKMHGEIRVANKDEGCCFSIKLPVAPQ